MNAHEQLRLWRHINEYAEACGADTSDANTTARRLEAIAKVEQAVDEIVQRIRTEAWPAQRLENGLIDLPANPTIQMSDKSLKDALVEWGTRGNMRHESTPDPRLPTPEEIEKERAKVMAEAKERAANLTQATIEEQVEFVKKAVELGCEKYLHQGPPSDPMCRDCGFPRRSRTCRKGCP